MTTADTDAELRRRARARLPRLLYDYIEGGAFDEQTVERNRADLDATLIRQRVMRAVSNVSTRSLILGEDQAMPFLLGPVGFGGMAARRGEKQAAVAAAKAGVSICLSTLSLCSIDEVARASGRVPWLQLYLLADDKDTFDLLDRAADQGVQTLIVTVDVPVPSIRYREMRRSILPPTTLAGHLTRACDGMLHPRWLVDVWMRGRPHGFGNLPNGFTGVAIPTPDRIRRVRDRWRGKLVIKGILDGEDARQCRAIGADAIVVSNHGGRQLDSTPSTIAMLPEIARAVDGDMTVLIDGGFRSGLDILKALAAGADGVLAGRAWVFALAAAGEAGVAAMLARVQRELATAMALAGVTTVAEIDAAVLHQPR